MNDQYILLCFSVQDELKRIYNMLRSGFNLIMMSSPYELMRNRMEDAIVFLDLEFVNQHEVLPISNAVKKMDSPVLLYIDSPMPENLSGILKELNISYVMAKHANDTPLITYTVQKAFDLFSHQRKMTRALRQYKNKLDETSHELESTKNRLAAAPSGTEKADILEEIIFIFKRGKIELPSHPKLSIKFKNLMESGASLNQIADLLRNDAAITTKLISISNSPYYRGMSNNKTLEQAIGRLGLNTTKQYVDVILNRSLYLTKYRDFLEIIERMWEHSLSCAYASQIVALRVGGDFEEDVFTLGLLHDIGKLILIQTIGELRKMNKLGDNFDRSELFKTINNYHCKFGASLLKRWKFSQEYVEIAAFHDNLSEAGTISKSLLVVHFANLLAHSMGYRSYDREDTNEDPDIENAQSTTLLKLSGEDIRAVSEETQKLMDEFGDFLKN